MSTTTQGRTAAIHKYENYVEEQLARARRRIRTLDLAAAGLGFLIGTLGYALVSALCDRFLELPSAGRQIAFSVYVLAAGSYLAAASVRLFLREINPYYAAKQVEQTLPGAKNSVVNWLDLHERHLPAAIRAAVSHRAAKDLSQADLETAISGRRALWLGGIGLALFLALFTLFTLGPRQFFSLMSRAFMPFGTGPLATRTHLEVVQPEGGNVTVPVGHAVAVTVRVEGKMPGRDDPDALKLLYRHHENDPYREQPLDPVPATRDWAVEVPAYEVQNGFWYKVAGGDAETQEYRVQVRSSPLITDFEVKYHYRPYLRWQDQTSRSPNIEGLRGTEVSLLARANRDLKEGELRIAGEGPQAAQLDPADPQIMRFQLVLERDGTYQVFFTSVEGERNADPIVYSIKVFRDSVPQVELTQPGKEISLPVNGMLRLEGKASDDFGITGMTLHMRVEGEEEPLLTRPYRDKKSFRLVDGTYPQMLDYKEFVDLGLVKQKNGQGLQTGMVLEYWLEATDNCDCPKPNVGRTDPPSKVKLEEPQKDQDKVQQERKQAQKDQQQHEAKQDQKTEQKNKSLQQEGQGQKSQEEAKEEQDLKKKAEELDKAIKKQEQESDSKDKQDQQGSKDKKENGDPGKGGSGTEGNDKKDKPKEQTGGGDGQKPGDPKEQKGNGQGTGQGDKNKKKPDGGSGKPGGESGEGTSGGGENKPGNEKPQKNPSEKEPAQGEGKPQDSKGKPEKDPGKGTEEKPGSEGTGNAEEKPGTKNEKPEGGTPGKKPEGKGSTEKTDPKEKDPKDNGAGSTDDKNKTGANDPKPPDGKGAKPGSEDPKTKPGEKNPSQGEGKPETKPDGMGEPKTGDQPKKTPGNKGDDKEKQADKSPDGKGESGAEDKDKKNTDPKGESPKSPDGKGNEKGEDKSKKPDGSGERGGNDTRKKPGEGAGQTGDKPKDPSGKGEDKTAEGKSPMKPEGMGDPKAGEPNSEKSDEKGPPSGAKPKDPSGKGEDKTGEAGKEGPKGKEEGDKGGKSSGSGPSGNREDEAAPGTAANPEYQKKAGELQLEDFRKKVNKDVLKKANMTEEEYQQFLKAYGDYLKRKQPEPAGEEKLADPKRSGGNLSNRGPERVQGGAKSDKDNALSGGAALPPPEFRDAYEGFTKKLSTLKRSQENR